MNPSVIDLDLYGVCKNEIRNMTWMVSDRVVHIPTIDLYFLEISGHVLGK